MDDHVSIRTHGDLGIRHFKKPPFGERLVHPFRIGQMKKLEPWKLLGRIVASRKKKETTQKKDNKRIEKLGGSTVLQFYRLFFFKNPWRSFFFSNGTSIHEGMKTDFNENRRHGTSKFTDYHLVS